MNLKLSHILLSLICSSSFLFAQPTVGLFITSDDAFPGYTLFSPMANTTSYLINNCGQKVHSWPSAYLPGVASYLLEDGSLLRTRKTNNATFSGGGSGGGIERIDWDGNVIWEYSISTSSECQHHDIKYMPNGNILAIVWENKSQLEASIAGRINSNRDIWSEKIVEIKPDLENGGGSIIWEWKAWDHIIQDVDPALANYGTIAAFPERININYTGGLPPSIDWLHFNSIDYNVELDQLLISCHKTNEIWIIDHSTTTLEAAGHSAGASGKGGDLLYRWGNPVAYNGGFVAQQRLFKQHDAKWIDASFPGGNKIMIFNNQAGKPENLNYSTVNIIDPPLDSSGNYELSGMRYSPSDFYWTYKALVPTDFFSINISGAHRLANGNTLICEGVNGNFFEVNDTGKIVWKYVNPLTDTGITAQGDPSGPNFVFRCTRYAKDYAAFDGRILRTQGYIETGTTLACIALQNEEVQDITEIAVYPNPAGTQVTLQSEFRMKKIHLHNALGVLVYTSENTEKVVDISVNSFAEGLYYLTVEMVDGSLTRQRITIRR